MSVKVPWFEIIRSDAGWHSRFVAANGRTVWSTEVYERRRAAVRAIEIVTGNRVVQFGEMMQVQFDGVKINGVDTLLDVRLIDSRTAAA